MVLELAMATVTELTPEQRASYARVLRRRQPIEAETRHTLERQRTVAWRIAREAAMLLRERYGATCVVVFGSLARGEDFSSYSDIDLEAWGSDCRRVP